MLPPVAWNALQLVGAPPLPPGALLPLPLSHMRSLISSLRINEELQQKEVLESSKLGYARGTSTKTRIPPVSSKSVPRRALGLGNSNPFRSDELIFTSTSPVFSPASCLAIRQEAAAHIASGARSSFTMVCMARAQCPSSRSPSDVAHLTRVFRVADRHQPRCEHTLTTSLSKASQPRASLHAIPARSGVLPWRGSAHVEPVRLPLARHPVRRLPRPHSSTSPPGRLLHLRHHLSKLNRRLYRRRHMDRSVGRLGHSSAGARAHPPIGPPSRGLLHQLWRAMGFSDLHAAHSPPLLRACPLLERSRGSLSCTGRRRHRAAPHLSGAQHLSRSRRAVERRGKCAP